jgi:Flp pilus assembly pilin Flp
MMRYIAMKSDIPTAPKRETLEKGASLVEYALLCCLIAVAAIAGIRLLGTNISTQFSSVATQIG